MRSDQPFDYERPTLISRYEDGYMTTLESDMVELPSGDPFYMCDPREAFDTRTLRTRQWAKDDRYYMSFLPIDCSFRNDPAFHALAVTRENIQLDYNADSRTPYSLRQDIRESWQ